MTLPKKTYEKRLIQQHYRCYYCGDPLKTWERGMVEIDHIIPRSICHSDRVENLCLACVECNRIKSDYSLSQLQVIFEAKYPHKLIRGMMYYQFIELYSFK